MNILKLKKYLVLLLLLIIFVWFGSVVGFDDNYLVLSLFGLLFYSLIEIAETLFDKINIVLKIIKITCLLLVFTGLTLFQSRDILKPVIFKTEVFSETLKNIRYKNDGSIHHNIYFETKLPIEKPVNLKIKDTYLNLAHTTDYDVIDRKMIFINYAFGNEDAINQAVADRGLVFTYETRDWLWGDEYQLYKQRQESLKQLGRSLIKKNEIL